MANNKENIKIIKMDHIPSKQCVEKIKKKYTNVKIIIPDGREL